jgi:hypothetical protein
MVPVYLESGKRWVFACALDWPGWCRRAKGDEAALDSLAEYARRYAVVAERAGVRFGSTAPTFEVVQRMPPGPGFDNVDFGALGAPADADGSPLTAAQAKRLASIVEASWSVLDDVVAKAPPQLRKGPRGGGRDRDAVFAHVVGAEASYARKLGVRHRAPDPDDAEAIAALRKDLIEALRAARDAGATAWPPRYLARRVAWHVLDHAWEIEDRSEQ